MKLVEKAINEKVKLEQFKSYKNVLNMQGLK